MNGAQAILETLKGNGVDIVFTNPGTSEMQFVAALDAVEGVRPILSLFEGVCTGAADGYGRIAGKPAATLLHLGPGLANGLANLHNAKRAGTPIVNIVGDHATYHLDCDAPLTSDIEGLASPMSHAVFSMGQGEEPAASTQAAIDAAIDRGGQVATLIVPSDLAWSDCDRTPPIIAKTHSRPLVDEAAINTVAAAIESDAASTMLLLGGSALTDRGLTAAARLQEATGCRVATPTFVRRLPRGGDRPHFQASPYLSEMAIPFYAGVKTLAMVDAPPPVAFFAYPGKESRLTPDDCVLTKLAGDELDPVETLERLVEHFAAAPRPIPAFEHTQLPAPSGPLAADKIAISVQRHMPENAIVVDEAITNSLPLLPTTASAPRHDWLFLTGGSIGQGMPVATGAALAAPDRKVINLEGDGSALYTIQSLWTQAREKLGVVTVIYKNDNYQILQMEMMRTGANKIGERAMSTLRIDDPATDFTALAKSFGVEAARVDTAEDFDSVFAKATSQAGPFLIEAIIG